MASTKMARKSVQKPKSVTKEPKNTVLSPLRKKERQLFEAHNPYVIHIRETNRQKTLDKLNYIRAKHDMGKKLTDEELAFQTAHMPTDSVIKRDYTVVAIKKQTAKSAKWHFGYSVCSDNDNFDKAKARLIATQRALNNPYLTVSETGKNSKDFGKKFLKKAFELMDTHSYLFDKQAGILKKEAEREGKL